MFVLFFLFPLWVCWADGEVNADHCVLCSLHKQLTPVLHQTSQPAFVHHCSGGSAQPSAKGSFSLWWCWPLSIHSPPLFRAESCSFVRNKSSSSLTCVSVFFLVCWLTVPNTRPLPSGSTLPELASCRAARWWFKLCPQSLCFYSLQEVKLNSSSWASVGLSDSLAAQRINQKWCCVTLETRS